ncbi:MAG: MerR family transcriptional regulator [Vicinamibacterales bacterium]
MQEPSNVEIPDRRAFKASEVCELARIQPYVLRSWESEFPELGVAKTPGGPRVYRRQDVELVLKIRQLVFDEGLTLSGARRRLDDQPAADDPALDVEEPAADALVLDSDVRNRLSHVRTGLRALLSILSAPVGGPSSGSERGQDFALEAPAAPDVKVVQPRRRSVRPSRGAATSDD